MTKLETECLKRHIRHDDVAWEWGAGHSTPYIAARVKHLTSVEHNLMWAMDVMASMIGFKNFALNYVQPDQPELVDEKADGDYDVWYRYVNCYVGKGVTLVIVDGRARPWCVRRVVETAPFGPRDDMRILLHDADRPEYERIWRDDPEDGWSAWCDVIERVENLMVLKPRMGR